MAERIEHRMYGLTPYNLSDIQKGIQFGHAVVEYQLHHGNDPRYSSWANNDKTFIILNGGTSNEGPDLGSMQIYLSELMEQDWQVARFNEPDINNALTGIVWLVPEMVYDKEKYPDWIDYAIDKYGIDAREAKIHARNGSADWQEWEKNVMLGSENVWMRNWVKQFRFA